MDLGLAHIALGAASLLGGLMAGTFMGWRFGKMRSRAQSDTTSPRTETPKRPSPPSQMQRSDELANHARDEFIVNTIHEIRTPLTAIVGFAELLLCGEEDEVTRRDYLALIRNSGKHLLELINDIRDLPKIKPGTMTIRPVECSAHDIVREIVALYGPIAKQKGLGLSYAWSGPASERITTDPMRFRQIVTNLVGNALKFTERGGVNISLEQVDATDGAFAPVRRLLALHVADTGIGIGPEELSDILEPFNQTNSKLSERFGETGHGLRITREIAQALGGKLTACSRLNEGSIFTAMIAPGPKEGAATRDGTPSGDASAGSEDPFSEGNLEKKRVLLVDDSAAMRRLVTTILRSVGAEVVIAENGKIGVEKALVEPFDIIVMDIQMPVLDGLRATQELRLKGMNIPIIALTAHVLRSELDRCMQAGCSAYLSKPVTVPLLLSAIRSALSEGKKPPQTPIVGLPQPEDSDASAAGEVRPESLHAQS